MRDAAGDFEVYQYNASENAFVGTSMGAVGAPWVVDGIAADPPSGSGAAGSASTAQLVQAMASMGGSAPSAPRQAPRPAQTAATNSSDDAASRLILAEQGPARKCGGMWPPLMISMPGSAISISHKSAIGSGTNGAHARAAAPRYCDRQGASGSDRAADVDRARLSRGRSSRRQGPGVRQSCGGLPIGQGGKEIRVSAPCYFATGYLLRRNACARYLVTARSGCGSNPRNSVISPSGGTGSAVRCRSPASRCLTLRAALVPSDRRATDEMLMQDAAGAIYEVYRYSASENAFAGTSMGAVGTTWVVDGIAVDPPAEAAPPAASTAQLVQAMASMGGSAAVSTASGSTVGVELSQPTLLTTPHPA